MFPSYKALHAGGMTYGPRSPASRRVTPAGIAAEAEVAKAARPARSLRGGSRIA